MRDPERIERMLAALACIWRSVPDMRLGQLVTVAALHPGSAEGYARSIVHIEDDVTEAGFRHMFGGDPIPRPEPSTSIAPISAPAGRPTLSDLRDAYIAGVHEGASTVMDGEPLLPAELDAHVEQAGEAYVKLWLLRVHEKPGGAA